MRPPKNNLIRNLTLEEALMPLGMVKPAGDLLVFATKKSDVKLPIEYPFRSDHFSFLLVTSGELAVKINFQDFVLRKNDLVCISANAIRQFLNATEDCETTTLVFTGEYLSGSAVPAKTVEAFDFLTAQAAPLINIRKEQVDILKGELDTLKAKLDERPESLYRTEVLRNLFSAILFEMGAIYQSYGPMTVINGSRKEAVAYQFFKILTRQFREERNVQAYADALNITPKYLSVAVKEMTGKTTSAIIADMVIVEAKVLLNYTGLPIAQIAQELHFSDQFSFSKFFRKHCKESPSQFRNRS